MKELLQRLTGCALLMLALVALAGCGEHETNPPAVKLTASVVTSATTNGHSHDVTIPFSDLASTVTRNYLSSSAVGHTHVIALTAAQFSDLYAGNRVIVTSSAAADGHTHTWELHGGNLLYESICYNCHSNDKRGAAGMPGTSYTPLQSQRDALANPAAAPLSTASPATPDPNYTGTPTTPTTGSPDGATLYAADCAGCHGPLASSTKRGRTAAQITAAIASVGSMAGLSALSAAEIQAIATALK